MGGAKLKSKTTKKPSGGPAHEESLQLFGAAVARLRERKKFSRPRLALCIHDILIRENIESSSMGESWIARLESGKTARISRQMLEAICQALGCSTRERIHLFLLADRNPFQSDDGDLEDIGVMLHYAIDTLYRDARTMLSRVLMDKPVAQLNDEEICEILGEVVKLSLTKQRRNKSRLKRLQGPRGS
jgi:transcriptional regulator with XRE-family HTH domain